MSQEDLRKICLPPEATVRDALERLSAGGKRIVPVVGPDLVLLGVLTDGDIRRHILGNGLLSDPVDSCYNPSPKVMSEPAEREHVLEEMARLHLTAIPEVDGQGRLIAIHRWDESLPTGSPVERRVQDLSVVIMAGGMGTRLDPLTRILPKALVPVGDRPILERIMEEFSRVGVSRFEVLLHHKGEMVRVYFNSLPALDYQVHFHTEETPLGTIGGLSLLAAEDLQADVLVSNCDIMLDLDWTQLLEFHRSEGADLTLVGAAHQVEIPYGVLHLGRDGGLASLEEKPQFDYLVNTGLYLLRRQSLEKIPAGQRFDATDLIQAILAEEGRICVFPVSGAAWLDIGNWQELHRSRGFFGGEGG